MEDGARTSQASACDAGDGGARTSQASACDAGDGGRRESSETPGRNVEAPGRRASACWLPSLWNRRGAETLVARSDSPEDGIDVAIGEGRGDAVAGDGGGELCVIGDGGGGDAVAGDGGGELRVIRDGGGGGAVVAGGYRRTAEEAAGLSRSSGEAQAEEASPAEVELGARSGSRRRCGGEAPGGDGRGAEV